MAKKILIIEDEKILIDMFKDKLTRAGFKVISTMEAREGLELAKKEKPDLILLDILLAGEDGIFFLKEFRKDSENISIPVVAFSTYDNPKTRAEAKELGAKEYLIKTDYTPKEIVEKVKSYFT